MNHDTLPVEQHAIGAQQLWCAVLLEAVHDAVHGLPHLARSKVEARTADATQAARDYVLRPHRDFVTICHLAGVDPDAVRERVARLIAHPPAAPTKATPITYTHDGKTHSLREWTELTGIPGHVITLRLHHGWTLADALTTPKGTQPRSQATPKRHAATLTFRNQTRTVRDWSRITGIGSTIIYMRLKAGWSVERTLSEPARSRGTHQRTRPTTDRGVGLNLAGHQGTGGGPVAQETPEIPFAKAEAA